MNELKKETAGALAYLLGPITVVFFLVTTKDEFVKFHAAQSIVVLGGLTVLSWALIATFFLSFLVGLVGIVWFVLWLLFIYKAWQGEKWEVPYVGKYAKVLLKKS